MKRRTKDLALALERAVEMVGGTVESGRKNGWRRVRFPRPGNGDVEVHDRTAKCLYVVVNALTTSEELGGFGRSWDEVRDAVRFYGYRDTGKGHENHVLAALDVEREDV